MARLLAAGLAAFLLAGCSGDESSSTATPKASVRRHAAAPPSDAELRWIGDVERWLAAAAWFNAGDCARSLADSVAKPPTDRLVRVADLGREICRDVDPLLEIDARVRAGDVAASTEGTVLDGRAESTMKRLSTVLESFRPRADRRLPVGAGTSDRTRIHTELSSAATRLLGKPVQIVCWSPNEWRALAISMDAGAFATWGGSRAHFSTADCRRLVRLGRPAGAADDRYGDAVALTLFAHELEHVAGEAKEANAECGGMQRVDEAAAALGIEARRARRLALAYWNAVYPDLPDDYRSAECHDGGALDLDPADTKWP